ncbi:MAG: YfhO family protein [Planctomycetaceae bacterium]
MTDDSMLDNEKPSRKEHLAALLCLLLAAAFCFQDLLKHPDGLLVGPQDGGFNDVTRNILASRSYPRDVGSAINDFPAWNPGGLLGIPWWGNPQSAMFYPLNWLYRWCDPISLVSWLLVLHHVWGGWGVYFWGRLHGLSAVAAVFAGSAYLAAPYLIANTGEGHYNPVCLMAWVPWGLICYEYIRQGRRRAPAWLAVVLALCFFCGHVQELFYLSLMIALLSVADVVLTALPGLLIPKKICLMRMVMAALLVAGLIAIDIGPIWIYTKQAVRAGGMTAAQSSDISLGTESLGQLLNPLALGGPADYRGPGKFYWETLCHFGLIVTALGVWGMWRVRQNYLWARWLPFLIVAFLFCFGTSTPVYPLMHRFLPGISLFRAPSRALFFCSLLMALYSGAGLDRLLSSFKLPERRKLAFALGAGLCCLSVVELQRHASAVLRVIPRENIRLDNPVLKDLQPLAKHERVLVEQDLLSDSEAWKAGVQKVQAYDPVPLTRFAIAMAALVAPKKDPAMEMTGIYPVEISAYRKSVLDLLGVRYAVVRGQVEPPEGWTVKASGETPREFVLPGEKTPIFPYTVLENLSPLPRAFVIGKKGTFDERGGMNGIIERLSAFDPREELLLPTSISAPPKGCPFTPATIKGYELDRIEIAVNVDQPGFLVLTDVWYPGWVAEVDGRPAPIIPANFSFRGVPISAGTKSVVFRYLPPMAKLGQTVTAVTLLIVALSYFVAGKNNASNQLNQPAPAGTVDRKVPT